MTPTTTPSRQGANYGLDAPGVVKTMALIAFALIVARVALGFASSPSTKRLGRTLLWPAASFAITPVLMILSSRFGKLRARDRLLDVLAFRGNETVLDVGCGHGLMLIGAAHRVPRGRVIGIDLWSQTDQHANSPEATRANADAEGVTSRVSIQDGDMRALPFDDESIDVIVSSLAIHNVPSAAEREQSIREIARVVRPGGSVGILDIAHVSDYARVLEKSGWTIDRIGLTPWIFPQTRELIARKPG